MNKQQKSAQRIETHKFLTVHELKCWKQLFDLTYRGLKWFEHRQNDRGYMVGDILHLKEYDPETRLYSGRWLDVKVISVIEDCPGLADGYCLMGIRLVENIPF